VFGVLADEYTNAVALDHCQFSPFDLFDLFFDVLCVDGLKDVGQCDARVLDHQRWLDRIEPLIFAFLALVDDLLVPKVAVLHEHPDPLRHTPTVPVSKLPIFLHNCVKYDYTIFLYIQQLIFKFQCRLTSNPA
jgi:hypothetical protein